MPNSGTDSQKIEQALTINKHCRSMHCTRADARQAARTEEMLPTKVSKQLPSGLQAAAIFARLAGKDLRRINEG